GRLPDPGGLNAGVAFLLAGGSLRQFEAILIGSPEFTENLADGSNNTFLAGLYQVALGRGIDPVGQVGFSNALAAGFTRTQVALAVLQSIEHDIDEVQFSYQFYLDRPADPQGLAVFTFALFSGASEAQLAVALVGSAEAFNLP